MLCVFVTQNLLLKIGHLQKLDMSLKRYIYGREGKLQLVSSWENYY